VIRSFKSFQARVPKTRAEIGDIDWRGALLEAARLIDHLSPPDFRDPERYFLQRSALSHELRRLARRAQHSS
jgi:hypothetical protein